MKISNFKRLENMQIPLNKWLFFIEIRRCRPDRVGIFKPYFSCGLVKFTDFGEMDRLDGRPQKKKGGWWSGEFPVGIAIEIIR